MGERVIDPLRGCVEARCTMVRPRVLGHSLEKTHPLGRTNLVLEVAQTIGLVGRRRALASRRPFIRESRSGWVYGVALR